MVTLWPAATNKSSSIFFSSGDRVSKRRDPPVKTASSYADLPLSLVMMPGAGTVAGWPDWTAGTPVFSETLANRRDNRFGILRRPHDRQPNVRGTPAEQVRDCPVGEEHDVHLGTPDMQLLDQPVREFSIVLLVPDIQDEEVNASVCQEKGNLREVGGRGEREFPIECGGQFADKELRRDWQSPLPADS